MLLSNIDPSVNSFALFIMIGLVLFLIIQVLCHSITNANNTLRKGRELFSDTSPEE